jgi:alkylation response protein AidB-like acyl-CoA dehydrogenase
LWGSFYRELIEEMKNRGAWFATAGQAATWFRERRSVVFEGDSVASDTAGINPLAEGGGLPGLRVRVHNTPIAIHGTEGAELCFDIALADGLKDRVFVALRN